MARGRYRLNAAPERDELRFLRQVAAQDLPLHCSDAEVGRRQRCKAKGWVARQGGAWVLTDKGRELLEESR